VEAEAARISDTNVDIAGGGQACGCNYTPSATHKLRIHYTHARFKIGA